MAGNNARNDEMSENARVGHLSLTLPISHSVQPCFLAVCGWGFVCVGFFWCVFYTLLSQCEFFSHRKFRSLFPRKASCNRVALPNPWRILQGAVFGLGCYRNFNVGIKKKKKVCSGAYVRIFYLGYCYRFVSFPALMQYMYISVGKFPCRPWQN